MHGFKGVSSSNYENLEYRHRLEETARALYSLGSEEDTVTSL
jgi:ADP-ribosylarginine hydrolase